MWRDQNIPGYIHTDNFDANALEDKRTYVIMGMARGGTTMVAGVASLLGLDIGEDLERNLEDPAFNLECMTGSLDEKIPLIQNAIAERNQSKTVWGWKYPHAPAYLPQVAQGLVNPHFIIIYRDFMAQTYRIRQTNNQTSLQMLNGYILRLRQTHTMLSQINCPTLMLSYEKCISDPDPFLAQMCDFLGAPTPDVTTYRSLLSFMKPGEYKDLDKFQ